MVEIIKADTMNELCVLAAKKLLSDGHKNNPRGLETIELNDVWLELTNPLDNICTLKERKLDMDYLEKETKWYLSGNPDVSEIEKKASLWSRIKNSNNTANSNYGKLLFKDVYNGKSQFEWCVDSIKKDSNTRQAIVNYNTPQMKWEGNKDIACTIAQSFVKRDNKLDSIVLMRSNDFIYGFMYDVPFFCKIQEMVSKETGILLGKYQHYAASFHVYAKHFKMLEEIASSNS